MFKGSQNKRNFSFFQRDWNHKVWLSAHKPVFTTQFHEFQNTNCFSEKQQNLFWLELINSWVWKFVKWYGEQINCKILDYLPSSIWCRVTNVKPESIFMALLCLLWQFLTWISWLPSGLCSKFALWDGERPLKAILMQRMW